MYIGFPGYATCLYGKQVKSSADVVHWNSLTQANNKRSKHLFAHVRGPFLGNQPFMSPPSTSIVCRKLLLKGEAQELTIKECCLSKFRPRRGILHYTLQCNTLARRGLKGIEILFALSIFHLKKDGLCLTMPLNLLKVDLFWTI